MSNSMAHSCTATVISAQRPAAGAAIGSSRRSPVTRRKLSIPSMSSTPEIATETTSVSATTSDPLTVTSTSPTVVACPNASEALVDSWLDNWNSSAPPASKIISAVPTESSNRVRVFIARKATGRICGCERASRSLEHADRDTGRHGDGHGDGDGDRDDRETSAKPRRHGPSPTGASVSVPA